MKMGTFLPLLRILVCMHVLWWGVQGMTTESSDDTLIDFLSGAGSYEGVVYYQAEGRRALICDQTWTNNEAAVACRMQGYEGGTATKVVDLAREDYTDNFQWDIVCDGDEERLGDCPVSNKEDNPTSCDPNNIAQVRCEPNIDWDMRMTGSEYSEQGRVETYTNGEWVKVWAVAVHTTYEMLCRAMGYDEPLHHYEGIEQMPFQGGSQDEGVMCMPSSDDIISCRNVSEIPGNGSNYETGIVCKPFDIVAYHPIRLVDNNTNEINNRSGLVEIYHDGQWGNICKNSRYAKVRTRDTHGVVISYF
ncbi:neurotrypsin [Strongylocentrotus purpuratus]|uniref:SRCR domain-containing protein n=1 Tax=Strongylocentrotus purpuratus TaxID=7668 RepID=A0A7M7NZF0_STRPU|nr:neurotrypsin [Strongylocentrotus purpuratus]